MTPRYFIWRESNNTFWRVYGIKRHRNPTEMELLFGLYGAMVIPAAWDGDDYQEAVKECKRLNAERRELLQRT